jgi:hypothetical protein
VPQYSHAIKAQLRRALAAISAVHLRESVAAVAEGITRVTAVLSQERAAAALCFGVSIRPQAHILASNTQHGRTHVHPHASLRRPDWHSHAYARTHAHDCRWGTPLRSLRMGGMARRRSRAKRCNGRFTAGGSSVRSNAARRQSA